MFSNRLPMEIILAKEVGVSAYFVDASQLCHDIAEYDDADVCTSRSLYCDVEVHFFRTLWHSKPFGGE